MRKLDTSSLAVIILLGGVYFYTHQNGGKFSLLAQIGSGGVASSVVTFTANPTSISYNATSVLSWHLENVKSCTALPSAGSSTSWYPGGTIPVNSPTYTFVAKWGSPGSGNGQFNGPGYMAIDASGNVYVADYGNYKIQKFSASGVYLSQWGSYGSSNGQFLSPFGVVLDASGNAYVVDGSNQRIQKFNTSGVYLLQWGSPGSGNGQFRDPYGIAVDASGNVYVTEWSSHRIQKFDSSGNFITKWGSQGSGNAQFQNPKGIAIDASGNVYVVDQGNSRIQKFNTSGTYLSQWGSPGSGNGQFNSPRSIATDISGNIYVADGSNNRIQKFNTSGTYLSQWGSHGSGNGQFSLTEGVVVDASGNVYVADYGNNRIQVFVLSSVADGSFVIGPLTTTTTYSLKCTGLDNTQVTKSVTVNVQASPPQVVVTPNTSGYAWSENVGWISFKNPNAGSNYGVRINPTNGVLSGYAWSEHIGWLDFNQTAGCPKSGCQPALNLSGPYKNEIVGWMKAFSGDVIKGWDGWTSLSSKNSNGVGAVYGVKRRGCNLEGYAWGSDVIGWVSFSSKNCDPDGDGKSNGIGYCPAIGTVIPAYGVTLDKEICENNPPSATIACTPTTPQCTGYTGSPGFLNFNLSMTDPDDNLKTCEIILDGVIKPAIPCGTTILDATQYGVFPSPHSIQIRVTDEGGLSYTTPPTSFTIRQDIQPSFECSLDGINFKQCGQLKILSGTKIYFKDISVPSTGGTIVTRNWQFDGGSPTTASGVIVSTKFTSEGVKNITLTVTEESGTNGRVGNTALVLVIAKNPDFKEIAPE